MMQAVLAVTGIARNKIVAYRLGPTGFGDIAQIALVAGTLGSVVSLGMGVGISRNAARATTLEERQSQLANANAVVLSLSAIACAVCGALLFSGRLLPLVGLPVNAVSLIATGIVVAAVPFDALKGNYLALLQGILDVKGLAVRRALAVVLATAIAIPVVWSFGFVGAAIQLMLLSVLVAVLLGARCRRLGYAPIEVRLNGAVVAQLASFGVVSLVSGFAQSFSDTVVRTHLIHVAGAGANGILQAPWVLAQTLKGIVLTSIGSISLATVSAQKDRAEMSQSIERLLTVAVPVAVSALGLLGLLGWHALALLYSGAFSGGAALFPFLLSADVLMAFAWVVGAPLLALGDRALWLALEMVYVVVRSAVAVLLIPRVGALAVVLGYLVAIVLHAALNLIVFRSRYRLRIRPAHLLHVLLGLGVVAALSALGSAPRSMALLACGAVVWVAYTLSYARRTHLLGELWRRLTGGVAPSV